MHTRAALISLLSLLTLNACHDGRSRHSPSTPSEAPDAIAAAEAAAVPTPPPAVELEPGHHRAPITEVVLDPEASAALTLDRDGGVRLWVTLDGSREPLIIPIDEPRDLSLARTETGSFVIAAVDTAGSGVVFEVWEEAGPRIAHRVSFSEPLFELHALGGGRLLALGLDHRVRLLDLDGAVLSMLDEPGFVPWQLRHVETASGIALAAVLAQPTRVQPLTLVDDQVEIVGEARAVELDRGPNQNDLALTPDGRHVAALTRPRWRGREWTLTLVNLADGSEAVFTGTCEEALRPRLHLLEGQRALIDDGSGSGQLIDLSAAPPEGQDVRPVRRALPSPSVAARMHASVVNGVRALPSGDQFIIDPLTTSTHTILGRKPAAVRFAGLSPDGGRVIWGLSQGWMIEEVIADVDPDTPRPAPQLHGSERAWMLADFVDEQRVILVDERGEIELREAESGALVAAIVQPPYHDPPRELRFTRTDTRGPTLYAGDPDYEHASLYDVGSNTLSERERMWLKIPHQGPWSPATMPTQWSSRGPGVTGWGHTKLPELELEDELGTAFGLRNADILAFAAAPDERWLFVVHATPQAIVLARPYREGEVGALEGEIAEIERVEVSDLVGAERLMPSPDGRWLAVAERNFVSVHALDSLERRWTRTGAIVGSLAWSDDGSRLALVSGARGLVLDPATGEAVLERGELGTMVETITSE